MICPNCKAQINAQSRFCTECGSRIDQSINDQSSIKGLVQLRCKKCGGVMDVEADRPIIFCQYCGAKELLNESERITVQRIKSKTHKEIELERLGFEKEKYNRQEVFREQQEQQERERELKKRQEAFRKSPLKILIIVFFLLSLVAFFISLSERNAVMAIITIVQAVAFATAWLQGMQFVKEKRPNSHLIFAIIGLLLILPALKACDSPSNKAPADNKNFEWPNTGICAKLPEPATNQGSLDIYSTSLHLDLDQMSIQDYLNYVEACKAKGFIIDAEEANTEYEAYNSEGYKLRVYYYDGFEEIVVYLENPLDAEEIKWPDTKIVKLLPTPPSSIGIITNNNDSGFTVFLTGVSKDMYEEYVTLCENGGFDLDQNKHKSIYEAKNARGYQLRVEYEGFNTIYVNISAPKK